MTNTGLEDTWLHDVREAGQPGRTGAWLIADDGITIVDPGSTLSVPHVLEGLRELGVGVADIRRIVVTHVHLDHMGGVGVLAAEAPRATVLCHPRAARHLVDPARLEASARGVYGDRYDRLWGALKPVPSWQVAPQEDLAAVRAGRHTFTFFDSPGHARHHVTMLDERTGALYTGDAVGIRYDPAFTGWTFVYGMPTTSPPDFDPPAMLATLDRLRRLNPVAVCHTHFGRSAPEDAFGFTERGVEAIMGILDHLHEPRSDEWFQDALREWVAEDLAQSGHPGVDLAPLDMDLWLNGLGMAVYWKRRHADEHAASAGTQTS
jgi:glyoxylase-like metal-dependent hydrolase (beta-lactamase superfamily II)